MRKQIIFTEHTASELYTMMYNAAHSGTFTVYVRGRRCGTEADFFREISAAMQFPYYFGENWAAFDECITDLEWLNFSSLLIVIDHFRSVFAKEGRREILMKHLDNAVSYWKEKNVPVRVIVNSNLDSDKGK